LPVAKLKSHRKKAAKLSHTDALAKATTKSVLNWHIMHSNPTLKSLHPGVCLVQPTPTPLTVEFYNRFPGRQALLAYAAEQNIPVVQTTAKPWSMDENMAHCSYEAGILEDPNTTPPKDMWKLTVDPQDAPNTPEDFVLYFEKGVPVKLETQGKTITEPLALFLEANAIARRNGVGRLDIVESRYTGSLKSRGCYESPGLTLLRNMHIDLEGLTLDREVRALRDQFVTFNFGKILYNGGYFTPEREYLSATLAASQKTVNGFVRGRCYKGSVFALGRKSKTENLYDENESSMDILGGFEPSDAGVFPPKKLLTCRDSFDCKAEG
jgi:argininosuccinate synthase